VHENKKKMACFTNGQEPTTTLLKVAQAIRGRIKHGSIYNRNICILMKNVTTAHLFRIPTIFEHAICFPHDWPRVYSNLNSFRKMIIICIFTHSILMFNFLVARDRSSNLPQEIASLLHPLHTTELHTESTIWTLPCHLDFAQHQIETAQLPLQIYSKRVQFSLLWINSEHHIIVVLAHTTPILLCQ